MDAKAQTTPLGDVAGVAFGEAKTNGLAPTNGSRVVRQMYGYSRVSTADQADTGLGLAAQRAAIDADAANRGWVVTHYVDAGVSGKAVGPQLTTVLDLLAKGQGDGLVVAKLDRLSRSIINAANIIAAAQKQGWALVVLDLGMDLTTPAGEAMAHMLAVFGQFERRMISQRTRDALAAKKARGERVGRPRLADSGLVERIVADRATGLSFARIAAALEAEGTPSPTGRQNWQASTTRRIYQTATATTAMTGVAK